MLLKDLSDTPHYLVLKQIALLSLVLTEIKIWLSGHLPSWSKCGAGPTVGSEDLKRLITHVCNALKGLVLCQNGGCLRGTR